MSIQSDDAYEAAISLIKSGLTIEQVQSEFPDAKIIDGALVLEPETIYATDGQSTDQYEGVTPLEAAEQFVAEGDWLESRKTVWVEVETGHEGLNPNGDVVEAGVRSHTIAVDPPEPDCDHPDGFDWQSPHELLGGLEDNPGVQGHGGGVWITEVCANTGWYRVTDSWAQNPETGEQGLDSIEYRPPDDESLEWVAKQARQRFLETADSRETSPEIMEAILAISGEEIEDSERIWDSPSDEDVQEIVEWLQEQGHNPSDLCWGAAGSDWLPASDDPLLGTPDKPQGGPGL